MWRCCSTAPLRISAFRGRKPDIFFIPKALAHLVRKNFFAGVPPLVIEILSPTTEAEDRGSKRPEYAQLGVAQYWIVDFPSRRIEVHGLRTLTDGTREYELVEAITGDAVFRPTMFPGLEIPLTDIWPVDYENLPEE